MTDLEKQLIKIGVERLSPEDLLWDNSENYICAEFFGVTAEEKIDCPMDSSWRLDAEYQLSDIIFEKMKQKIKIAVITL